MIRFIEPLLYFYTYMGISMRIEYHRGMVCQEKNKKILPEIFLTVFLFLAHIGKPFDCFGKAFNGFICIAVLNPVPHTMLDMSF